jgi:hypothetical protein
MWCVRLWGVGAGPEAAAQGNPGTVPICVTTYRTQQRMVFRGMRMDKQELIEGIREINKSATPEFLASFSEENLRAYLDHLMEADVEEEVAITD